MSGINFSVQVKGLSALLTSVKRLAGGIRANTAAPVRTVTLSTVSGLLWLTHVSGDTSARVEVPVSTGGADDAQVSVDIAGLLAALKTFKPTARVRASIVDGALVFSDGIASAQVAVLADGYSENHNDARPFRSLVPGDAIARFSATGADLAGAVSAGVAGAGSDDTLPMLMGARVRLETGKASIGSTDRFRLALAPVPGAQVDIDGETVDALIPAKPLAEVAKVFAGAARVTVSLVEGVEMSVDGARNGDTWAHVSDGTGAHVLVRGIDASFPKIEHLLEMTGDMGTVIDVDARALAALVKGWKGDRAVIDVVDGAIVTRRMRHADNAVLATAPVSGEILTGANVRVAFTPEYFASLLSAAGKGRAVIRVVAKDRPALIDVDGARLLLMPVRLGAGNDEPVSVDAQAPVEAQDRGSIDAQDDAQAPVEAQDDAQAPVEAQDDAQAPVEAQDDAQAPVEAQDDAQAPVVAHGVDCGSPFCPAPSPMTAADARNVAQAPVSTAPVSPVPGDLLEEITAQRARVGRLEFTCAEHVAQGIGHTGAAREARRDARAAHTVLARLEARAQALVDESSPAPVKSAPAEIVGSPAPRERYLVRFSARDALPEQGAAFDLSTFTDWERTEHATLEGATSFENMVEFLAEQLGGIVFHEYFSSAPRAGAASPLEADSQLEDDMSDHTSAVRAGVRRGILATLADGKPRVVLSHRWADTGDGAGHDRVYWFEVLADDVAGAAGAVCSSVHDGFECDECPGY